MRADATRSDELRQGRRAKKISDALYDAVSQTLPSADGLARDLLPGILMRVNFYEIAHALVRDIEQTSTAAAA